MIKVNGEPSDAPLIVKFSVIPPGHDWMQDCRRILNKTNSVDLIRDASPEVRTAYFLRYRRHISSEYTELMEATSPEEFFKEGCDMCGLFIELALAFNVDISTIWINIWGRGGSNDRRVPGNDPRRERMEGEPMDLVKPEGWVPASAEYLTGSVHELKLQWPIKP